MGNKRGNRRMILLLYQQGSQQAKLCLHFKMEHLWLLQLQKASQQIICEQKKKSKDPEHSEIPNPRL